MCSVAVLLAGGAHQKLHAQDLQANYDRRGLAFLSYRGTTLVDLNAGIGDAFYVGDYNLGGTRAWGAIGNTAAWDAGSQTLTWSWKWGSVACQFAATSNPDRLNVTLTVKNKSGQVLKGLNIYPFGLQFPSLPQGFGASNYPQFHNNLDGPGLIAADYGSGMTVLADGEAKPLYVGLSPSGKANHYELQVGTINDSSEGFLSKAVPLNRSVAAGQTAIYTLSLRFAPSGTDYHSLAGDVLTTFGRTWPQRLRWTDRRPIGELFMTRPTTSPLPNTSANPRNYTVAQNIDIQSPSGVAAFQRAVLAYADNAVRILKSMNAQAAIVWDLEGQQYPQPNTSYAGDPSQLAALSPEMDQVADAFFKKFTNAGLKCGMTIRPQRLNFSQSPPVQTDVPASEQAAVMIQKMQYAENRWGCTIFYVDSDGGPNDATAPSTFSKVAESVPNALIVPENIWTKDLAYTAPLGSFTAPYKPLHTSVDGRAVWPHAFTMTYVGDAPNHDLHNNPNDPNQWKEFVQAVKNGDILSFRAWFDDEPLNGEVKEIYREAGK